MSRWLLVLSLVVACSNAGTTTPDPNLDVTPVGQLPDTATPTRYSLSLTILPAQKAFAGETTIDVTLNETTDTIWLHGRGLEVEEVLVERAGAKAKAEWAQLTDDGVARVKTSEPLEPGPVHLHFRYSARFDTQLKGLYRVDSGGHAYAFTQFEAISARLAFPSFDEPRFKTPFDVSITTSRDNVALANTPVKSAVALPGDLHRTRYHTSRPMPTYLVAFAVGPLDIVEAPAIPPNDVRPNAIPFRGVAAKGRGKQLKYALERTPAMVADLEAYFGTPYPYKKLDVVAVPDFGSGAMENVGLIKFREWLLLVDERGATEDQKRAFAYVMAHELAHQWFGNLVTMPWWDDIWLNEAFATWMGNKTVMNLYPEYKVGRSSMKWAQEAMAFDSLTSARRIRQPIESNHDIRNAFDSITYEKGGAVLEMFEHWLGKDAFRDAIRQHMKRHAWGTATATDLLASLDSATGKDVSTPFQSFLTQPGLPKLATELSCANGNATLRVTQSRYFPVGSPGDPTRTWHVPLCVRQASRQTCTMLSEAESTVALPECGWYMPNENAAAYARFSLTAADWRSLQEEGFAQLSAREQIGVADSVGASFDDASLDAASVREWFTTFAQSDVRQVVTEPMEILSFMLEYGASESAKPRVAAAGQALYRKLYRSLGWRARKADSSDMRVLRESVLDFMVMDVEDASARRRAAKLGRAYVGYGGSGKIDAKAVGPQLADLALATAVQEGDAKLFDHLEKLLEGNEDATVRNRLLSALGHARNPELSARALALVLDPRLRNNEVGQILRPQFADPATRPVAWAWLKANYNAVVERVGARHAGWLPWRASRFCSADAAADVKAFFEPKVSKLTGGPRNLEGALERIGLCAARVEAQRAGIDAAF